MVALEAGDPARLGPFTLVDRLGEGGQGVVFLGRGPAGEQVAVKLLHTRLTADPEARERFLREVALAQRVARFCTAPVLHADLAGNQPYIVSEFVPGPSLRQLVDREGPRRGAALERLAISTATALAAIHRAGITHRDFKPANVLMGPEGPVVIDFGVARALDSPQSTATGASIGTPAYLAPEVLGGGAAGGAADMFAWGVTMVFAATGKPAFGADTIPSVINRILNAEPDLGDLGEPLRAIVTACLSKNPATRPSAEDVVARLTGQPTAPVRQAAVPAGGEPPRSPHASPGGGPAGNPGGAPGGGPGRTPGGAPDGSPGGGPGRAFGGAPGGAPGGGHGGNPSGAPGGARRRHPNGRPAGDRRRAAVVAWTAAGVAVPALVAAAFLVPTWVSARQISAEDTLGPSGSPSASSAANVDAEPPIPSPSTPVTTGESKGRRPSARPSPVSGRPTAGTQPTTAPSATRRPRPSPARPQPTQAQPTEAEPTRAQPTPVKTTPAPVKTTAAPKPTSTQTAAPKPNPYTAKGVCGSGYAVVDSHSYGQATTYLLYNSSNGYNCVVTMSKYVVPGKIKMSAALQVQGGSLKTDSGSYTAYAGPVRLPAKSKCVIWGGGYGSAAWTSGWSHCG